MVETAFFNPTWNSKLTIVLMDGIGETALFNNKKLLLRVPGGSDDELPPPRKTNECRPTPKKGFRFISKRKRQTSSMQSHYFCP